MRLRTQFYKIFQWGCQRCVCHANEVCYASCSGGKQPWRPLQVKETFLSFPGGWTAAVSALESRMGSGKKLGSDWKVGWDVSYIHLLQEVNVYRTTA